MTAAYFNTLDEIDQLNLVFNFGVDIAQRTSEGQPITLYQLFSFYVEVSHSEDKVYYEIRSFDETKYLDIYIEEIDLVAMLGD